jgi:hypothetical protein
MHALVGEIRLQADRQIGAVPMKYLEVLFDSQKVIEVHF